MISIAAAIAPLMRNLLAAAALAFAALAWQPAGAQSAAAQPAPDPCAQTQQPVVRDHRQPPQAPIVRDHRQPSQAPSDCQPSQPIVRDHRQPSQQPIVRDHRLTGPSISPGGATVAQPPIVRDQRAPDTPVFQAARYIVRAMSLYANDETGPDFAGSDEILILFRDQVSNRTKAVSFGDFDTGETRRFDAYQNCITPVTEGQSGWDCQSVGAPGPIDFRIRLQELDDYWERLACGAAMPADQMWDGASHAAGCDHGLIGNATITLSVERLAAVPQNGDAMTGTVRIGGYTLTYGVQRVR